MSDDPPRVTYRRLISPLAQIEAAVDFVKQMNSRMGDEWRESDDPADKAKHEHPSTTEFLDDADPYEHEAEVLDALFAAGVRFEMDGEERGTAEGYFLLAQAHGLHDMVLRGLAARFHRAVEQFAPKPWRQSDTFMSLGWENLLVVPDQEGVVERALALLDEDRSAPLRTKA
jgi:hypothetical protein